METTARLTVTTPLSVGETVRKIGGDYIFCGKVVAIFAKTSGLVRVVVENEDGVLHIFGLHQLEVVSQKQTIKSDEVGNLDDIL